MSKARDAVRAARMRSALEDIARTYAAYCAHQITAEAAAYRSGEVAVGELCRGGGGSGRR